MITTWRYSQTTGLLECESLGVMEQCYSGNGEGKNKHSMQSKVGIGPIPTGWYTLGERQEHPSPVAYPLIPDKDTETFGRSGFMVHGDSIAAPGTASHGCIVAGYAVRPLFRRGDRLAVIT